MRKEYDFTGAKRAKDVPHLAKLQARAAGREGALLTEQQQKAPDSIEDEPLHVVATASESEAVREIVEDEKQQRDIRAVAFRNVARRLAEDL